MASASQQFAAMTWESRWNKAPYQVMYTQQGPKMMVTCIMGTISFDLRKDEDVEAIIRGARSLADSIEKAKKSYDMYMRPVSEWDSTT